MKAAGIPHEKRRPPSVGRRRRPRGLVAKARSRGFSIDGCVNDAIGRRTSMSRSGSAYATPDVISYTYNDRSELTGASSNVDTAYSYSYAYDPVGNRITASEAGVPWTYTTNSLNQYTSATENNVQMDFSYDLDGSMTYRPVDAASGWTQVWNGENRMVETFKGNDRLEFRYDYMGRRFEKKVYQDSVLVKHSLFVYDGFRQIAEYDALSNNALANAYVWQPFGLGVPLLRNGSEFYVSDANKNVIALIGATGQVTDTYIYGPFGNCTHTGSSTNPFRFSSEYFDGETVLVYYNFRYFSSELGRWIKRDSIGESGDINIYQYSHNNPSNLFDRYGLSVDSITASLNDAIAAGNVEAVKTILEAASGLLPKAVVTAAVAFLAKNAKCKKIHEGYKQYNCKKCNNCTSRTQAAASAKCFANELQGRMRYLAMDCDAVLEGSIKRGVDVARKKHWDEYAQKQAAMFKCLEKAAGK